jgi:hypothetical protein
MFPNISTHTAISIFIVNVWECRGSLTKLWQKGLCGKRVK